MQSKKKRTFFYLLKRLTAFLMAVNLGFSGNIGYSAPSSFEPAVPPTRINLLDVSIPKDMGSVKEKFEGQNEKTVFIIQDAHEIPDAQRSIQKLIDFLQTKYGIGLVALEGAASDLDPQIFRSFPDQTLLRKVFEQYFDQGELAGGTAAAILNQSPAIYHGVEDWNLYEEGLKHFLDSMEKEESITERVENLFEELKLEKEKHYSKDLLRIDVALQDFRKNAMDLVTVLEKLAAGHPPEKESELGLLLEEVGRSRENHNPVEMEVKRIADQIGSFLKEKYSAEAKQDLAEFNQKFQEFQTQRMAPEAFALYLKGLTIKHRIKIKVSKRLNYLVGNQKRMKDIEGTKFFDDFQKYAQSVKEALFQNDEERKLDARSRQLELLERLAKLELSREDWNEVKEIFNEIQYWNAAKNEGDEKGDIAKLLGEMRPQVSFYHNAGKRDHAFIKQVGSLFQKHKMKSATFIAGGFHAEGVTYALKSQGISYVLVMPNINQIPDETRYRDHMKGEVSWGDYFEVQDGKVNLYDAFVRGTRDLLLKLSKEERGKFLKSWRDQIIRDLAEKGKLTETKQYTRFIDEVSETGKKMEQMSAWEANINRFIERLSKLRSKGQITEENIAKLLQPSAIPAGATAAPIARSELRVDLIPTLTARSEVRTKLGGQESVSERVRFDDVRRAHVEFEWKASAEAKPITIDYVLDQRMVYQLALLGISPNDFISEIMQEIDKNEGLAELKLKMFFLGRSTFDIDPISVYGGSYDEDMPIANFLSHNVAKEILKRMVFDAIAIKKKKDRLRMFGGGEDTMPAAEIKAIPYYRGRFTNEELYESLKGSLMNGLIVYNEIGALMQNRGLNEETFEDFKAFVKENEHRLSVKAKKLAYQLIYYQNMQNDVEDRALEAQIAELETLDDQISDLNNQWTGLSVSDEREKIIKILKEILQLDPNDLSIKSTLAVYEKSAQREREQIAARESAENTVRGMSSYANSQLFDEVYRAIASNNPILGTALLKLLSTRDLSLSEINQILAFLPNLAENYKEASDLFSQFSAKYRQSASEVILNGLGLDQEVQEIVQKIYIQYFEDSAQRRKALLSIATENKIDLWLIDQMESRLQDITRQQIAQIEESNKKVGQQSKKGKRFGFDADLQAAVDALEAKYGLTIEIPFEEDVTSILDRPTMLGSGRLAELYSKKDILRILEKLKELDQWLAVLPRDVVLKSLSFQKLEILKNTRAHFHPSDKIEENKIALGMESESPKRTLYHEVGHSLHGPSGEFAAYIDPVRLTDLILKHRELFAANDPELVSLAERKEIGVWNRSQVTWRVFQAIFDERKKGWLKMNKDLGVVDLNAPFKPQRTSEAIAQTFEREGVSSDKQVDKPSLTIEYIFEEPFFDNRDGQLTRKEPIELIAEYTQLYVLFPDSLKRYDEVAFDFLEPILGSVHSRSEAREQYRALEGDIKLVAESVVDTLNPQAAGTLGRSELRQIYEASTSNFEQFTDAIMRTWENRTKDRALASEEDFGVGQVALDESGRLIDHLRASREAGALPIGSITVGLRLSAQDNTSFLAQLFKVLQNNSGSTEVLAEADAIKNIPITKDGPNVSVRPVKPMDWQRGFKALRSEQEDVPVALDVKLMNEQMEGMFNGILLNWGDAKPQRLVEDFGELLFAVALVEMAKIFADPNHKKELALRRTNPKAKADYLRTQLLQRLADLGYPQEMFAFGENGYLTIQGTIANAFLEMKARAEVRKSA